MKKKKKAINGTQMYDFTNPWAGNYPQTYPIPTTSGQLGFMQPNPMHQLPTNQQQTITGFTDVLGNVDFNIPENKNIGKNLLNNAKQGLVNLGKNDDSLFSTIGGAIGGPVGAGVGAVVNKASKALGAVTATGLPLINSLVQDNRGIEDISKYDVMAYNPYSQGTGSQAIYKNGGRVGKKSKIIVTEEPADALGYNPNRLPNTNIEPMGYYSDSPYVPRMMSVDVPKANLQKSISFEKIYDREGGYQFSPVFTGYDYNSALNEFQNLPDNFGGIPVQRSPELFSQLNTGFIPGSDFTNWNPIQDNSEPDLPEFKNGGKVSRPIYTNDPEDSRIRRYNDSMSLYNEARNIASNIFLGDGSKYNDSSPIQIFDENYPKKEAIKDLEQIPEYAGVIRKSKKLGIDPIGRYYTDGESVAFKKPVQPVIYDPNRNVTSIKPIQADLLPVTEITPNINYNLQIPHQGPKHYRMDNSRIEGQGYRRMYEDGGHMPNFGNTSYMEGEEYDLTIEEIKDLISKGYELKF